jgi:hypothetical protein
MLPRLGPRPLGFNSASLLDARLHGAVEARVPVGVGITQSRTIRAESMRLFGRTFAITRVLRLLAAVIAFPTFPPEVGRPGFGTARA